MSGETRDLFAGVARGYPEPADAKKNRARSDWLSKTAGQHREAWRAGFVEGLGRAAELAMEQGDHGTVCRMIEEGARRFGDLFLDELARRGINVEDLV